MSKKKLIGLKTKLENAIKNVSIGTFGYEEKVTKNIHAHFNEIAVENDIPISEIHLRISTLNGILIPRLFHIRELLYTMEISELIQCILGESSLFGANVGKLIHDFLQIYSTRYNIAAKHLTIRLFLRGNKAQILAYNQKAYLEEIPLKELIKHFMK